MMCQEEVDELDPDGVYGYVTAPGEQRGDPTDNDEYIFVSVQDPLHLRQHAYSAQESNEMHEMGGANR